MQQHNAIKYFPCPACGSPLSMTSSRMITSTMREQYARCNNEHCGGGFTISSSVTAQLSPPSDLFADKVSPIPLMDDVKKKSLEMAIEFLGRQYQSQLSDDDKIAKCRDYLLDNLQISTDRATVVARVALADWHCAGFEKYSIDKEQTKSAVIINEGMTTQHVISLPELVKIIADKRQQQLI